MITGPITEPHAIETCYGSVLHCISHDVDEACASPYRVCFECGHVYATAADLVTAHIDILSREGISVNADIQAAGIYSCVYCTHDW